MKAKETNLLKFLQGPKQFQIPIFQRTYSWELRQCDQLWRDVYRVGQDADSVGHFMGSVVYIEGGIYVSSAVTQLVVIDGQQRLATLALLLAALARDIETQRLEIGITRSKLENYYIFNAEEEDEQRHKLLLTRKDRETLIHILEGRELPSSPSPRLVENYKFFEDRIRKADVEVVYSGVQKLLIVDISLERRYDNPQLIFESLNSTGLDLSQADLIRNYVLMGQEPQLQTRLYEEYWFAMEQRFGDEYDKLFDRFMRDYLTLKTGRIPKIGEVYSSFKDYVQDDDGPEQIEAVVSDINYYSKHYVRMALETEQDPELRRAFADINTLRVDVAYPFLLEAYEDYVRHVITKREFVKVLRLVESYVFRRAICGIPTNSLNKTFATLTRNVDKGNYLDSLAVVFLRMMSYRRFPLDGEFREEFIVKDVYNFRSRNYLLGKLENHQRKELVSVEQYTIEHVMPQNEELSATWRQALGERWREVQEKYLHSAGNLTLTGYNPELSDRPFQEKRDMPGGFADSPIRLNQSLAAVERWDEAAILGRARQLSELATKIWAAPSASQEAFQRYAPQESLTAEPGYTLEEYPQLTGEMLTLFGELRPRVLGLDRSIAEDFTKFYIAYKSTTNFVDVVPQKNRLKLLLNMRFSELDDPRGWCRDVTDLGRWGNGDVEVHLSAVEQIEYVMFLVRQAFNKQVEYDD